MPAMIFGTDAVPTPDPVVLPSNDNWFTDGNGTTVNGTQVPSYWVNKVGGEIENAITASGQALNMSIYNQLANLFALFGVEPAYQESGHGITIGPGYSGDLSAEYTATCNGFLTLEGWINVSTPITPVVGSNFISIVLSNSVNGLTKGDSCQISQYQKMIIPVTAGQAVTGTLGVSAGGSGWAGVACTYYLTMKFTPTFS